MFIITIPIKPYVKHYLVTNFSEPADLSTDKRLNKMFRDLLKRPVFRHDKRYNETFSKEKSIYSQSIEILISESDFYRYGWELTKTNTIQFNSEIESRTKEFMRRTVEIYENLMSQKEAILKFQEEFGFSEDIWPYESIKKDYYRNTPNKINIKKEIENNIIQKISEKFMANVSPKKDNVAKNDITT